MKSLSNRLGLGTAVTRSTCASGAATGAAGKTRFDKVRRGHKPSENDRLVLHASRSSAAVPLRGADCRYIRTVADACSPCLSATQSRHSRPDLSTAGVKQTGAMRCAEADVLLQAVTPDVVQNDLSSCCLEESAGMAGKVQALP